MIMDGAANFDMLLIGVGLHCNLTCPKKGWDIIILTLQKGTELHNLMGLLVNLSVSQCTCISARVITCVLEQAIFPYPV